jgi:uncharacterized protein (TIGR03067 family)
MKSQVLTVVTALLLAGADRLEEAGPKQDLADLQGIWSVVALEYDGTRVVPNCDIKYAYVGNRYLIAGGVSAISGKFTLLNASERKGMDCIPDNGEHEGKTLRGIYQLESDKLTICCAQSPEQPRPTEWTPPRGKKYLYAVLKRVE